MEFYSFRVFQEFFDASDLIVTRKGETGGVYFKNKI